MERIGAQRARLRQVLGARAAEGVEFVLFAGLVMPWIATGLRPQAAPWFGLTIAPGFMLGWLMLALRGDASESAGKTRNRLLLALCLAACMAGGLACVIAFTPKKEAANDWTPPAGTLETQIETEIPPPSPPPPAGESPPR